jgi:hypothetical protein
MLGHRRQQGLLKIYILLRMLDQIAADKGFVPHSGGFAVGKIPYLFSSQVLSGGRRWPGILDIQEIHKHTAIIAVVCG